MRFGLRAHPESKIAKTNVIAAGKRYLFKSMAIIDKQVNQICTFAMHIA